MTDTTPLSPAAQAVMAAIGIKSWRESAAQILVRGIASATLRAAADLVVPRGGPFRTTASEDRVHHQLLAIAAELEGQP